MVWFGRDKGDVVSLARSRALIEVEAYWQALRRGRQMPLRSEVDPRGILGALPDAFLLERIAPTVARIRVAGSHISDFLGMEARGMPASCLIAPVSRDAFGQLLEDVLTHPATAQINLDSGTGLGRPAFQGQMLLLPLRSANGDVGQILGCLATQGKTGKGPRRFEIKGSAMRRIRGAVAEQTALPVSQTVHETAEERRLYSLPNTRPNQITPDHGASVTFRQTTFRQTKAAHLKLVVSEPA